MWPTPPGNRQSPWNTSEFRLSLASLTAAVSWPNRYLADDRESVRLADLANRAYFAASSVKRLCGLTVLLVTAQQLPSAAAMIALDGVAGRILLATPDLVPHVPAIITAAQVDVVLSDDNMRLLATSLTDDRRDASDDCGAIARNVETEWVLFTSGTTGRPKMVAHTLSSLAGPLDDGVAVANGAVWSTFYDIRRYGGLQILLRALLGGGSMVLSRSNEPVGDFLMRLAAAGVTHISGTPSHWRRVLMSHAASAISPNYVRMSGEVADQATLDRLRDQYPQAKIAHAFASTEAGVAFDVRDGLAGFPTSFLPHPNGNSRVEMRVEADTLRIRSSRTATRYIGDDLPESDGFIDTGDMVEQRGGRYYFVGRKEGVINVGGQKVYPEEVESVLTQHPDVLIARVWPRRNPITGAVVAADLVRRAQIDDAAFGEIVTSLRISCQQVMPPYKVPATFRRVDMVEMTDSGKLRRA
jgi:acyl-coenzyme A synthetase/AMP-(fatty) acid ligase